jgi:hypothetical protein
MSLWSVGWLVVCSGVILLLVALWNFVPALQHALRAPTVQGVDERLTNISPGEARWLNETRGGRWGRYGWYLSPRETGSLRIHLPGQRSGSLKLRLWIDRAGPLSVSLVDGENTHQLSADTLDGEVLTFAIDGSPELIVNATNDTPEEHLILDRFAAWSSDSEDHLPPLYPLMGALGVCLAGWGGLAHRHKSAHAWSLWVGCALILLAASVGWGQRWALLEVARGLPADPDLIQYRDYARSLDWFTTEHGFYSGTFAEREPMHVAAIQLWSRVWGDTIPAIRWYSVVQSNVLVIVTGVFVWMVSGEWVLGAAAAWIMALSPAWSEESIRGLRTESETVLFLVAISLWLLGKGWVGAITLGTATGLLSLLRAPMLGVVLPLVWIGWTAHVLFQWRSRSLVHPMHWEWKQLSVASCLAVLIFSPHVYGLYRVHGDASWPSYGYARWNANFEFPERIGTDGFPSAGEFAKDPYAGPKLTYRDYLFGLHSIASLVKGQLKGWLESTAYMSASVVPHVNQEIVLLQASGLRAVARHADIGTLLPIGVVIGLTMIGWVDLWRYSQYWWVSFLTLWGTWYVSYLYSVRLVEPFRHTAHVHPLLVLCLVWGGAHAFERLMALKGRFLWWRAHQLE